MPHVAAAMVLFHYSFIPRCAGFALSYSLVSLFKKSCGKETVQPPFHLRVKDRNIQGAVDHRLCLPRKGKCRISASLHSSLLSLSAHKYTWTSPRYSCLSVGNKAGSLARCATKSDLTCLWEVVQLCFLLFPKPACCLHPKAFFFFTQCNFWG